MQRERERGEERDERERRERETFADHVHVLPDSNTTSTYFSFKNLAGMENCYDVSIIDNI